MIHISGTFVYQPPGAVVSNRVGIEEFLPGAIAIGVMILNDDGTPVFGREVESPDITAFIALTKPFASQGPSSGVKLELTAENNAGFGYVQLTSVIQNVTPNWRPMAIVIVVGDSLSPGAVITAAPDPVADVGIAPPVPPVSVPGKASE
jgi:hypothetical protein